MQHFILILSGLFISIPVAHADFYIHTWENHHTNLGVLNLRGELGYFTSTTNFNANSTVQAFNVANTTYNRIQTDFSGVYGLLESLSIYGTFSWARVSIDQPSASTSSFGLGDQIVGANYRLWKKQKDRDYPPITIDIQTQLDFPPYSTSNSASSGTPFLGDGTVDWTTGALITYPVAQTRTGNFRSTFGIGYTYRNRGFSAAIPYSVAANYTPRSGKGISIDLAAIGTFTLSTDRTDPSFLGVAPNFSYFSNAINPSIFSVKGKIGYQLDPSLGFDLGFLLTTWGKNAPNGFYVVGGVSISIDPSAPLTHTATSTAQESPKNPLEISPDEYGKPNQGLVYYGLEGTVLRVKDRMNLVKINKGTQDAVEVGYIFDIFSVKQDGSLGEAIARGRVTSVKLNESVLAITDYFKEVWIDEGFIVKRVLK